MLLAFLAAQAIPDMNLVCRGRTVVSAPTENVTIRAKNNSGGSGTAQINRNQLVETDMTVGFRVTGGVASVYVPTFGRWLRVKRLVATEQEITGVSVTNPVQGSRFRIDRVTGEITSEGGFRGLCEPQTAEKRKF